MANNIGLAKKYLPLLDELYQVGALTSILDATPDMVRESLNAKEILIPKLTLQGLGDYDRTTGAPAGSVNFEWETHTFNYDRGRKFAVDAQDNMESVDMAFGKLAGQFIGQHVTPEVDATRFAVLSAKATSVVSANLDKDTALPAYDTAIETLKDLGVDESNIVAYISPKFEKFLKQSGLISRQFVTNVGQAVINREVKTMDGVPLIVVPKTRFYSAIDLLDGVTLGEEVGGYAKALAGKDINFLLVDVNRVMGIKKSTLPAIFSPEENQDADAWKFRYRLYHDILVPDNAKDGIYVHTVA